MNSLQILGVGIEKHIRVQERRGISWKLSYWTRGLRESIGVVFMESKYKKTFQEGSVAMPWVQSTGLLEVGSMLWHVQTDSQI